MLTIGLIPLDSRPCNTTWISRLGGITNIKILSYPQDHCGNLTKGARTSEITTWLENNFTKANYWIMSVDAMVFGGLIQARKAEKNDSEVEKLISTLKKFKTDNPNIKIYCFDTIMRTSITALNKEDAQYWALVNEYSKYKGKYYFLKDENDLNRVQELERLIPKHVIDIFLKARNEKHSINMLFLHLLKDKIIDDEILLQEDSMPYGIQQIEQEQLTDFIHKELNDKVNLYNGTDEGALIYLAKIILDNYKGEKKVYIHAATPNLLERVHLFEDHLFSHNLCSMAKTIGIKLTSNPNDSNIGLFLYGEDRNIDLDLCKYTDEVLDSEIAGAFSKSINSYLSLNKQIVLVDLMRPNGGNPLVLNLVDDVNKLGGYSAWNTSSNSLGSAFAQIAILLKEGNVHLNQKFTKERIIDDCYYQFVIRRKLNEELLKNNINIYNLQEKSDVAMTLINKELAFLPQYLKEEKFELTLPWNRTFECDVVIKEGE